MGDAVTALSPRRTSIALLAGSLLDLSVVTSSWRRNPLSSESGPRGLAPFRERRCETCKGSGRARDRFRREVVCSACDGAGRLAFDAYTGERVGTAVTPTVVRMRSALCDRCGGSGVWKGARCSICDGQGRREWSPFELHMPADEERVGAEEGGLLARPRHLAVLWAAGSYAELERALGELRPLRTNRVWVGVYVHGGPAGDVLPADLEVGWRMVEERMPARVRVPRGVRQAAGRRDYRGVRGSGLRQHKDERFALAARDSEIRRLWDNGRGMTATEISREFGLQKSRVYEILNREAVA